MIEKSGSVVAIDGPAGAGKSTLARRLASSLNLPCLTTGLMYRAVAKRALDAAVDVEDEATLVEISQSLSFELEPGRGRAGLLIDGRSPPDELQSSEVEAVVSVVARHPRVRAVLREEQRRLGAPGAVVEGRDIGTVVFPDADAKIFLHADPGERVARRRAERGEQGIDPADAVVRRDRLDAKTNPLEPAEDAHVVDTTGREADEVLAEVLRLVEEDLSR